MKHLMTIAQMRFLFKRTSTIINGTIAPAADREIAIKRVIDRKSPTCQNNNRLHTQPFWTPLDDVFKSVPDFCIPGLFAVLGKATIDHSTPVEKWHPKLNLRLWPLNLTSNFDLDLDFDLPCFAVDKNERAILGCSFILEIYCGVPGPPCLSKSRVTRFYINVSLSVHLRWCIVLHLLLTD